MPDVRKVQSLELPELQPYRTLRRPMDHQRAGIFVAEGGKVVQRMINSGIDIVSLLMTPEWLTNISATDNYPVFLASQALLETIVGFPLHQGIMGIGRIPQQPPLDQVLETAARPWMLLALDGLEHAENVGLVVRNAAAFGAQALLYDRTSSHPFLRRAVRNSMGAIFRLPAIDTGDLAQFIPTLRERNITVVAAHPGGSHDIATFDFTRDVCIVLGNEGGGISERVLHACDCSVAVPMHNDTDSLNVASAGAVFLYEIARQRGVDSPPPRSSYR